jgi:riboflavin kinase/FMN adenylyltransferase
MLGRPYAISGKVVAGDKLGRTLNFPTANLEVTGRLLPSNGVYSAVTKLNGQFYHAALNIGFRPTIALAKPQLRVEAYLLDFNGDLYGVELDLEIGKKLRDEQKFSSVKELQEQINRDVLNVRKES